MARGTPTLRQRLTAAASIITGGTVPRNSPMVGRPMREQQGGLAYDPDLDLSSSQGGSRYFRPITQDPDRSLSPLDQQRMLEVCRHLRADNALARRIIERRTNYALGPGLALSSADDKVKEALDRWWVDDQVQERMVGRVNAWRTDGELLVPATVNEHDGGVRTGYIDPALIERVVHQPGDIEQRLFVQLKGGAVGQGKVYWVIQPDTDPESKEYGQLVTAAPDWALKHLPTGTRKPEEDGAFFFRANALPGQLRGISDLWHIADYLDAYETVIWDTVERAALLNVFLFWMKHETADDTEVERLADKFGRTVPKSGSILHTNNAVTVEVLSPDLAPGGLDTLSEAVLAVIATGAGVPKYWLNSDVDPNRASAEAMAVPVLRDMGTFQAEVSDMVEAMAQLVAQEAKDVPQSADREFEVMLPELGEKEALRGAAALQQAGPVLPNLRLEELLDEDNAIRAVAKLLALIGVDTTAQEIRDNLEEEREAELEADLEAEAEAEEDVLLPVPPVLLPQPEVVPEPPSPALEPDTTGQQPVE